LTNGILTSIELFTGAGGLALGISRAGFRHLALVERDEAAASSLISNRLTVPEMRSWPISGPGDVVDFDFSPFREQVDLLAAGTPCQPFSRGGKHLGDSDDRNQFPAVFAAVRALKPRAVLIENVTGLQREAFKDYLQYIHSVLAFPSVLQRSGESWQDHHRRLTSHLTSKHGRADREYIVQSTLLNAADFGVGQTRERLFIVSLSASMREEWRAPTATHDRDTLLRDQWVTGDYWKDHGLKIPRTPVRLRSDIDRVRQRCKAEELTRWRTVRDVIKGLPEPLNSRQGSEYTNHVTNPGARIYPGHTGSQLDWPAKTLKAGQHGVPGGENMLVRKRRVPRYFTIREAARLQTFPDSYHFTGSWCDSFKLIGNAVPVMLATMVAESVAALLSIRTSDCNDGRQAS
jgi:DNA (cytosine-5)-methyltransferase 1